MWGNDCQDREKDRESERAMRRELARVTAELKRTGDDLLECEGKMKQDALTLRRRNDDIIKLSKALRAAQGMSRGSIDALP